jgi:hypothetical protein
MMDEMLNQQARLEGHRPTILSKNDAYSSSSNYTRNIAYNPQSHRHSQNLDDPSIYYYSTNSAEGPNHSQNPPQNSSPNTEGDTRSFIGNYTQNIAYKRTSGGADDPEDPYYYSTNTAYGASAQGQYEVNVAYGIRSEDRTGEEEEGEGEQEIDYYYSTPSDRQQQDPEPSGGFTDDIEAH